MKSLTFWATLVTGCEVGGTYHMSEQERLYLMACIPTPPLKLSSPQEKNVTCSSSYERKRMMTPVSGTAYVLPGFSCVQRYQSLFTFKRYCVASLDVLRSRNMLGALYVLSHFILARFHDVSNQKERAIKRG